MNLRLSLSCIAALALPLVLIHCGDDPVAVVEGEGCSLASDCQAPLVCAFQKCHNECDANFGPRDCEDGERCVISDGGIGVCFKDEGCSRNSDCPEPLICGVDGACRNQCDADKDCPLGSVCANATCALETEVDEDGGLTPIDPEDPEGDSCVFTSQCHDGLVCRQGRCQKECLTDVDCDADETCNPETSRCERTGGFCGDGVVDEGESCDDGNTANLDSCSNDCEEAFCGDGAVQPGTGEFCDDANTVDDDACTNACTLARCGDGILHPGEACDDGNFENDDGCPNDCQLDICPGATVECGGSCVNLEVNPNHCGACGNGCDAGEDCVAGSCVCEAGLSLCDSACVNTTSDESNCGSCGNVCDALTPVCSAGQCVAVNLEGVFSTYESEARTVALFQSPQCAVLADFTTFCEDRGMTWWAPQSAADAQLLIDNAFALDEWHTWIQTYGSVTSELGSQVSLGLNGFPTAVDGGTCMSASSDGWTAFRKWACSLCDSEVDGPGVSCCWDSDHTYDWFACQY